SLFVLCTRDLVTGFGRRQKQPGTDFQGFTAQYVNPLMKRFAARSRNGQIISSRFQPDTLQMVGRTGIGMVKINLGGSGVGGKSNFSLGLVVSKVVRSKERVRPPVGRPQPRIVGIWAVGVVSRTRKVRIARAEEYGAEPQVELAIGTAVFF